MTVNRRLPPSTTTRPSHAARTPLPRPAARIEVSGLTVRPPAPVTQVIRAVLPWLALMLSFSIAYNMARPENRPFLRRLDHAGIFLMIAGSYTPFMLAKLDGPMAWTVLALVWLVALAGIVMNLLSRWNSPRVMIMLYLGLGWAVLTIIDRLIHAMSPVGLGLLAAGGILYTIGVVFHVNKKLPFNSAIWHGFVIAAASCHFAAIYLDVAASAGVV